MSSVRRLVAAPPPLRQMRSHWLLRHLAEPACYEAQSAYRPSGDFKLRAWRELVLQLSIRGILGGPNVISAGFASVGSARSRAGGPRTKKLEESTARMKLTANGQRNHCRRRDFRIPWNSRAFVRRRYGVAK